MKIKKKRSQSAVCDRIVRKFSRYQKQLKISTFAVYMVLLLIAISSAVTAQSNCRQTTYSFCILRYMSHMSDSTIKNQSNYLFRLFERSVLNEVKLRYPLWQRCSDTLEERLSKSFRLDLNQDQGDRDPVENFSFPIRAHLDSLGIKKFAVFYIYNDDDHEIRKKAINHVTEKQRQFKDEDIYFYTSINDIKKNCASFDYKMELDQILKKQRTKDESTACGIFSAKALEAIEEWGCDTVCKY
jgi:hypothetical protein